MPGNSTRNSQVHPDDDSATSLAEALGNQLDGAEITCPRCSKSIPAAEKEEHDDWHFAKDLEVQDRQEAMNAQQTRPADPAGPKPPHARGKGSRGGRVKPEKGQMRLAFQ